MPVLAKPKPIINEAYLTAPAAELLIAPDPATADPTSTYPATRGAAPKPLKPGPVAIFISKKEGKLFVREGFEPVFDIPIKIENPDIPLGTHVYTATQAKEGGLGMDWIALSLPPEAQVASRTDKRSRTRGAKHQVAATSLPPVETATATEALDRVELPAEALERLAEMLSPGASLIISDKGLGPQTGKGTNFIVLSR